jgi:hypothetical protein
MVLSFNFEQLGNFVLQKDYSWMVPIIVRTSKMKTVLGGWSHMLKRFFTPCFWEPTEGRRLALQS